MEYILEKEIDRSALFASLKKMPAYLVQAFSSLSKKTAMTSHGQMFSPVEQVWHLADLEREGFGVRIQRLLREKNPQISNFEGARMAKERNYRSLDLHDGLAAFGYARLANIELLQSLTEDEWARSGSQDGVGKVSLCDIPALIAQHDDSHKAEIEEWKRISKSLEN